MVIEKKEKLNDIQKVSYARFLFKKNELISAFHTLPDSLRINNMI